MEAQAEKCGRCGRALRPNETPYIVAGRVVCVWCKTLIALQRTELWHRIAVKVSSYLAALMWLMAVLMVFGAAITKFDQSHTSGDIGEAMRWEMRNQEAAIAMLHAAMLYAAGGCILISFALILTYLRPRSDNGREHAQP